jgi:hypothetical protein
VSDEATALGVTLADMHLYGDLHEMRVTLRLHFDNYGQLRPHLLLLEDPTLYGPGTKTKDALRECVRTLHNFLASAKTLVDHSRRHVDQYLTQTSARAEYDERVSALNFGGLQSFVQDLRNYTLHKTAASVGAQISATPDGARAAAVLKAKDIREWDGWSASARQYIDQAGDDIVVRESIDEYMCRIKSLYDWLREVESLNHADLLRRMNLEIEEVPPLP